jgi:hypothetical protein
MSKKEIIKRLEEIQDTVGEFSSSTVKSYIDDLINDL